MEELYIDIIDFANIPCVTGALEYLRNSGISSIGACKLSEFEDVRSIGKAQVLEALRSGTIRHQMYNAPAARRELLAYPVARIIVSCINSNYLTKRYALAVARRSYEYIRRLKDPIRLKELAEDFNIAATVDPNTNVTLHFTDYIRYSHFLRDPKWRLSSRTVKSGMLTISRDDLARLLEEAVQQKVGAGLPHEVPKDIREALEPYLVELRDMINARANSPGFSKDGFGKVVPDCFPQCISSAIADVQANVNLSHAMRFAMTAFLLNIGMTQEKVMEVFRASPDFKEQKTGYQISHINGASGTVYTCPGCATMEANGNCPGKSLCKRIGHPLVYYRRRVWMENRKRMCAREKL